MNRQRTCRTCNGYNNSESGFDCEYCFKVKYYRAIELCGIRSGETK